MVIRVKLPTTDLFLFYISSQRHLNELCIIISLTLLTPVTFSINTNLDLDINTLLNKITSSLDTDDLVIGVFLDLKKAFDTVDHKIILDKMHAYGIRGNILRWFRSYLTNTSQFVSYDGRQSEIQSITCGIPQGSILCPLLFIIYMNDICNVSELLFTVLYADDTCVVIH